MLAHHFTKPENILKRAEELIEALLYDKKKEEMDKGSGLKL